MKGMLSVNRWKFAKFYAVRVALMLDDIYQPLLLVSFIAWIQDKEQPDTLWTTAYALLIGLLIPILKGLQHSIWEYFCFEMIECGHRAHTALKTMLFKKDLRMSNATNKDFSEGEVGSIIMGETGRVWTFIWTMPDYIECPFNMLAACYFTFHYIGWYGFIVVFFTIGQFVMGYFRGSNESEIEKEKREKHDKRMSHINESFHNIKGVKLYGWESKFLEKIEALHQEEVALEDRTLYRRAVYELIDGALHQFMPLLVYGLYVYNGNALSLSSMVMANTMMGQIQGRIHHMRHLYGEYFRIEESMVRLNSFYFAPEVQRGLIDKKSDEEAGASEYALTVKGSFSWGITSLDKEQKDKLQEKARKKEEKRIEKSQTRIGKIISGIMPKRPHKKFDIPL